MRARKLVCVLAADETERASYRYHVLCAACFNAEWMKTHRMSSHSQAPAVETAFLKIVNDDSVRRTYVVFSSVDIEPGKFMFWRVMATIAGSKIFVNEEENGWYVHGIPTLGGSVPEAATSLLGLINNTNPEEVIFLGPSMGGYAAMLYGAILKPELPGITVRCLSFGGEFLLYERETRSKALSRKEPNPKYADLRPLLYSSQLSVAHIFGDTDITDIYQSTLAAGIETVQRIAVKNGPHAVSTFIGQNYNLIEFIRAYGETGDILDIPCSNDFNIDGFGENLFKGHLALIDDNVKESIDSLNTASALCPEHAITRHKLGIALFNSGDLENALLQQNEALRLNPEMDHAYFLRGTILSKLGRPSDAEKEFEACFRVNPNHVKSRFALLEMHVASKRFEEARTNLSELQRLCPEHTRLIELESHMKKQGFIQAMNNIIKKTEPVSSAPSIAHIYVRRDHTTDLISKRAAGYRGVLNSFEDCEQSIFSASDKRDWITVAALGLYISSMWPHRIRGPLAHHDGLKQLRLMADAREVIENGIRNIGAHAPLLQRLIAHHAQCFRFESAISVFKDNSAVASDHLSMKLVVDIALTLKDFKLAKNVVKSESFPEKDLQHYESRINKTQTLWDEMLTKWENSKRTDDAVADLISYIDEANVEIASAGIWSLYQGGRRDTQFLDVATRMLPTEHEASARLLFFRTLAYDCFPSNKQYAELYVRACFCSHQFEYAYNTLIDHSITINSPEYLKLRLRAKDIVGYDSASDITAQITGAIPVEHSQLEAVRAANLSTWRGENARSAHFALSLLKNCNHEAIPQALRLSTPNRNKTKTSAPKVAVCISGQFRSAQTNIPHILSHIVQPLNADVFVHTWDKAQCTPPRFRHIQRFIGNELTNSLPTYLRETPAFAARFPTTTRKLLTPIETAVTPSWLERMIEFKKLVVETETEFLDRNTVGPDLKFARTINQAKMFYKIQACDNLRRSYELETGIKYDAVIRIRPDLQIVIPELESYVFDAVNNSNRLYVHCADVKGTGDQFAIGSPEAMQAYASMWSFLEKHQRYDYLPGFTNDPAETLVSHHVLAAGLETRIVPTTFFNLAADLAVSHHDLTAELEFDASSHGDPKEVESFLSDYRTWHHKNFAHPL